MISEHILKEKLSVVNGFHSHLEPMQNMKLLDKQISLSYSEDNTINLDGPFSTEVDPTRLVYDVSLLLFVITYYYIMLRAA